jgi:DNA polymerase elongation subunit (family B)
MKIPSNNKLLVLDIETSPNVGYFWRPGYNVTLNHSNIVEERKIICVSYKYLGKDKVYNLKWDRNQCDKKLLEKLGPVIAQSDGLIMHNGDRFDLPWIKGRILHHELPPLNNVQTIDTLKLARSNFNLNSNTLDYVSKFLGNEGKLPTDFGLWKSIMKGDRKALKYMCEYCDQDVVELEKVFMKLLPYFDKLPINLAILNGGTRDDCPCCGSHKVHRHSIKVTKVGRYQKYQCQSCGHVFADSRMLKEK